MSWQTIRRIIGSLKVRKWNVTLDTDDYITNARLVPLFTLFNQFVGNWQVNYEGKCKAEIKVTDRPIDIIWALIR